MAIVRSSLHFLGGMFGVLTLGLLSLSALPALGQDAKSSQILSVANQLLEEAQVSYVYGGRSLGDGEDCARCNSCLVAKNPKPSDRFQACPQCRACSLDCSHFTELVFREAGVSYPYLATAEMLGLSEDTLERRYELRSLGRELSAARPGDLLVYAGHVVILERLHGLDRPGGGTWRGDIVHATGGRDIKLPGQGIQRERFVDLRYFRGPLQRILRHIRVGGEAALVFDRTSQEPVSTLAPTLPEADDGRHQVIPRVMAPAPKAATPVRRLRPVLKRAVNED